MATTTTSPNSSVLLTVTTTTILLYILALHSSLIPSTSADAAPQQLTWKSTIKVDQSGSGHYTTIQAAIDAVPSNNVEPVLIRVEPGVYKEKVVVPADKPHIILTGTNAVRTVVTSEGSGNIQRDPTFTVLASNFVGRYLTFQNTHGPGNQAVALRVSGDMATFFACRVLSYQDTLLAEQGRQYYYNCYVEGDVDFIFGSATAIFEQCHVHSLSRGGASITAQMRSSTSDNGGFYFVKCKVTGVESCVLGRPWGPYSRVVYVYTYMSGAVLPQGWDDWGKTYSHSTVYYGEYRCYGPGANRSHRVWWSRSLTSQQASAFTTVNVIQGNEWIKV